MRTLIAITALALSAAGAAHAYAAEDRYGPPPAPSVVAAAGVAGSAQAARSLAPTPYTGPMLSWTGKTAPRATAPAPVAPTTAAARPAPFQPQAPRAAPPQQQAALPQSLYDRPMVPMAAGAPAPAGYSAQSRPAAAPAAPPPPPRPQAPQRLTAPAGEAPRAYSVMREFGTPDPTQLPPPVNYWATRPSTAPTDSAPATIDGLFEPAEAASEGTEEPDLTTGPTAATRKLERRNQ